MVPQEYLSGGKLKVEEIGPYVYEEVWEREDVEWSEDGSEVDFRMKRTYHYRPDRSSGSLTDSVVLPNVPMFVGNHVLLYIYRQLFYCREC